MNNTFNINRFVRLFIKHTAEQYRTYLMSVGVLSGVMLLGGAFMIYMVQAPLDPGFQSVAFIFLMLISGTIFTSTVFNTIGDKKSAIPVLTLPASQLEKYVVRWVYSYFIFIPVYTAVFCLVFLGLTSFAHTVGHNDQALTIFQGQNYLQFVAFSMLHAITIFGAIFFEKLHFIKTAICFFLGFALLVLFNTLFLRAIVGRDLLTAVPFGYLNFTEQNHYYSIGTDSPLNASVIIVMILVTVLFWVAGYFRLKEKQV